MEADDSPTQAAIINSDNGNVRQRDFEVLPKISYRLDHFRTMYAIDNRIAAEKVLHQRTAVAIADDERFTLTPHHDSLVWDMDTHFLDHICLVPKAPGLDAFLPRRGTHNSWEWRFDVSNRRKPFAPKHSSLGFDPSGRMVWAGTCQGLDVWIAMAPNPEGTLFTNSDSGEKTGGSTIMPVKLYNITMIFFAYTFRRLGVTNIDLYRDTYPADVDSLHLRDVTNIL